MILLPARAVPVHRFFEVLRAHGCTVSEITRDQYQVRRDVGDQHFLEVWAIEDADYVYPLMVERVAELLQIPVTAFDDPEPPY